MVRRIRRRALGAGAVDVVSILFRGVVSPGDDIVHTALVTPRDTIALLVHSFAAEPREVTVKPLHLPAGEYAAEVYAASRLDRPEEAREVNLGRMTPVYMTVPPRRESLLVIRPAAAGPGR